MVTTLAKEDRHNKNRAIDKRHGWGVISNYNHNGTSFRSDFIVTSLGEECMVATKFPV
ncbi:hypothetical protein [Weissella cibaria]|uniref:hypothetical protein n=1 Tax=Weissella cibaria TaxID=137591 RepID=UPI003D35E592